MIRTAWSVFADIGFRDGRVFETHDAEKASAICSGILTPHKLLKLSGMKFYASLDHFAIDSISLCRLHYKTPVQVDAGALEDVYILCFPISGHSTYQHGNNSSITSPFQASIVGGGERLVFTCSSDYEAILVCLKRQDVEVVWAQLSGDRSQKPICFFSELSAGSPAWVAIEPVLQMMVNSVTMKGGGYALKNLHPRLKDILISMLLLNQPHSYLHRIAKSDEGSSVRVRNIKAYMLDNLEGALTLSDIAHALNISSRTVQAAFYAAEGMGPIQWLRYQRLLAARQVLLDVSSDRVRIADVAIRFGFFHLGEFSQYYRQVFCEKPSETLRRRLSLC